MVLVNNQDAHGITGVLQQRDKVSDFNVCSSYINCKIPKVSCSLFLFHVMVLQR